LITAFIIIGISVFLLFFFFRTNENKNNIDKNERVQNLGFNENLKMEDNDEYEVFTDENDLEYKLVQKTKEIPRRTYIKANLNGKFWGEIDENYSNQFANSNFYDFTIYEVALHNSEYSKAPFKIIQDYNIPREKLPKLLKTILQKDGKVYEVNLHEPTFELGSLKFNRKLHQVEGNEVFGTIDAVVTGYILDFIVEHYTEKEYLIPISDSTSQIILSEPKLTKTGNPTGTVDYKENYRRIEYFYSDYKTTYWSDWKYSKPSNTSNKEGCFSSLLGLIGIILGIGFLLLILPSLAYILPFFLIIFLLNIIPSKLYNWVFRFIAVIILIGFVASLFHLFSDSTTTFIPEPIIVENPKEQETQISPIIDTVNNVAKADTLIKHYRVWKDYDENKYEGYIWTKRSDYNNSKQYKNNLNTRQNTPRGYDEIIYLLKEKDKQKLKGVYQLFDSIRVNNHLSNIKFAELLVSFVQDIPYAVILPDDCNPRLYDDKFIQDYLNSKNARCDGFEKFGINSPVEFMSNLYGDCDTRTLLLYTMLSHYGFDVALFSSEYYSHSIIGVNLPIDGIAYKYGHQRYVLWETTASNIRPGILPKEISNLNYWRISLKSK